MAVVEIYGPTLASLVIADCARLQAYRAAVETEITLMATMSPNDIEKEFIASSPLPVA